MLELEQEVAEIYWSTFSIYGLGHDFDAAKEVGWNLIDAGRPSAAILLNTLYLREGSADEELAELLTSSLEAILAAKEPDPEFRDLHGHQLEEVFNVLALHRGSLGLGRVVALEWQFLPVSSLDGHAPTLHAEIKSNPNFFVELIVAGFRAASDSKKHSTSEPASATGDVLDEEEIVNNDVERQRSIASRAWEVLRSNDQVPGVDESGKLDAHELRRWIDVARDLLSKADRSEVGDKHIGELLSHSPLNTDGSPLPIELRDLLEDLKCDAIMMGLETRLINALGFTTRGLTEGGNREILIAEKYRGYAIGSETMAAHAQVVQGGCWVLRTRGKICRNLCRALQTRSPMIGVVSTPTMSRRITGLVGCPRPAHTCRADHDIQDLRLKSKLPPNRGTLGI